MIPEQSEASEETHCFPNVVCSETDRQNRYSRIDGLCNNLAHPSFGAAGSDFFHLVETENLATPDKDMNFFYENGSELPNARLVSEIIHGHETEDFKAENMSLLVMQFGQFLDHDVTLTPKDGNHYLLNVNLHNIIYLCQKKEEILSISCNLTICSFFA